MHAIMVVISPAVVQDVIGHLKCSKSDGGSLSSDHIISAPSIYPYLAHLFTSILKHSCMPSSLHDAMIQPILPFLPITMELHLHPPSVKSLNGQFY